MGIGNYWKIGIPWEAWYKENQFFLNFPRSWKINILNMEDSPSISDEMIEKALLSPIGSNRLVHLAKKGKNVVILIDDISRPTPTKRILPFIIDELVKGGIKKENIKIVISLGAHRPLLKEDILKKVGSNIWKSISIYNHNPYENNIYIGNSSSNNKIFLNKIFYQSDLKICIGCIVPHSYAGFSGGGKIVLPGIAGMQTIERNHAPAVKGIAGKIGVVKENKIRQEIEEIAIKSGLNFIINVVVNSKRQIAGLFVGDVILAHREGVEFAKKIYRTSYSPEKLDVGIFNAFPKDTDLIQAINALNPILDGKDKIIKDKGIIVITTASPEGEGYHSLEGYGMKLFQLKDRSNKIKKIIKNRKLMIFSPNLARNLIYRYYSHAVDFYDKWDDLLDKVEGISCSKSLSIGIFPNASLQILN